LEEGYIIAHKGLLCWLDMTPTGLASINRLLFYALEGTFGYLLWAMRCSLDKDYCGMGPLCLWDRAVLEWDGLCSHCAFSDPIREVDFGFTPEEIEEIGVEREARFRAAKKVNACNWHYKQMATNYADYISDAYERVMRFRRNRPGRYLETQQQRFAKAVEEKRYYCEECKVAFTNSNWYKKHFDTDKHKRQVEELAAQLETGEVSEFYCHYCNITYAHQASYTRHLGNNRHQKAVAEAGDAD
jgi:hypothetical protein